jgi:hypothetical protein
VSDPELVDESADNAQSADVADGSPPPWGEDFDAARAWQTISHLRKRESELESDAKAWKRFREDEDARRETLTELGYEFEEDGEDDEFDDEPVEPTVIPKALQKELDDLKAWRGQQEQREAKQAFDEHIGRLASESEVELTQFEKQAVLASSVQAGFNPKATEKAFKDFLDYRRSQEQQIIERYGESKKAPRFSSSGKSATNVKPVHEMTTKERHEYLAAQYQSG